MNAPAHGPEVVCVLSILVREDSIEIVQSRVITDAYLKLAIIQALMDTLGSEVYRGQ